MDTIFQVKLLIQKLSARETKDHQKEKDPDTKDRNHSKVRHTFHILKSLFQIFPQAFSPEFENCSQCSISS